MLSPFLEELMEMLSNFLGVRPEQNMRELPYPISSYRKLKERLHCMKETRQTTACAAADRSTSCHAFGKTEFSCNPGLLFDKLRRLRNDTGSERESFERVASKRATSVNETSGLVKDSGQMLQRSYWYREVVATGLPVPLYRCLVSAKDSGNG